MNTGMPQRALHEAPKSNAERDSYYEKVEQQNLRALWTHLTSLSSPEPKSVVQPIIWHYDEIRPLLFESVPLISVEEAERRVLNLVNPGIKGRPQLTNALMAGLQLVLPGEIAMAHRHSPSALRFIVEGVGAYTAVDGEKAIMHPGDFIITPSMTWHDHGNETDVPVVWLDVLDIPLVAMCEAIFTESYPEDKQMLARPTGDSLARYGSGLLPVDYEPQKITSPIFAYPYSRTRESLESMRRTEEWDPCHGLKLRFVNPVNGDYAMPTIGTFMQLLPKGFSASPYRSTDSMAFSVIEGRGKTFITRPDGTEEVIAWGPRDIFVVPSWCWHRHETSEDAVLFSVSDRPIQQKFGLWREMRGNR